MSNKAIRVFSFSVLALMVSSAMAEQVIESQISAVTVYPASATVTRTFAVELPAGPQTVLVAGLPATLDENSLRITGSGDKGSSVASVELKNEVRSELVLPRAKELQDKLIAQQDQLALLQADELALNTQQIYLQKLAEQGGGARSDSKSADSSVAQWRTGWQTLGAGMKEIGAAKVALAKEIRVVKQQIDVTQRELEQLNNRQQDNKIAVVHLQSGGGKLAMKLSYQLSDASWYPVYDANLDTQQSKLAVTQAAYVQQNTGENWDNVALTLSTLQPSAAVEPPALSSWWIDYLQPVPRTTMTKSAGLMEDRVMPEMMAAAAPVEEQKAAVIDSGYHVSYQIPGKISLNSSEEKQRVVLQQQQWPVALNLQVVPRFDTHAYLYARLENPSATPLLPGEWLLQRDGVRVGKVDQPLLAPKDQIAMGFGADDAVKLEWQTLKDEAGQSGVLNKQQTLQRHYQLQVTNGHNKPMTLTVLDSWPVSKQQDIKVSVLEGTVAPKEQNVDQEAGIQRWELPLPAGKAVTLDTGYQVAYPQDKEIGNL
ncbi:hypothetical protein Tola_0973 [Tolumonas auensis DSM 9187]|uniref:Mucoidy inhibitor A n=1 Tax=Tolumonas auensis (strain DSM 9187 / NBRC 110442 / TA 4) TaxID=595494 RepID=C4LCN7_TOLAT|nr:DUF4139 domain-containing protein [Tolumonas auensis]ACQ92601.1 hypothetical protein Tola_0973 [Tolumonas auensis DSM 9187]